MTKQLKFISVRISEDLDKQLFAFSEKSMFSRSLIVKLSLRNFLRRPKW